MAMDPLEKVRINKRIEEAQTRQMEGAIDEARAIFQELHERYAEYPGVLRGIGILCVQQGQLLDAERWLREASEREPGEARHWNDLGEALRLLGRLEEATAAYSKALELQPLVEAMNNIAVALAGQGDLESSKRWLNQAIEAAPEDPYPYNNLGVVLEAEGKFDEALQNYESAVKLKSDFNEAKENYASLLSRQPDRLLDSMNRLLADAKRLD